MVCSTSAVLDLNPDVHGSLLNAVALSFARRLWDRRLTRQHAQPQTPNRPSFSFSRKLARIALRDQQCQSPRSVDRSSPSPSPIQAPQLDPTHPIITLNAPSGVTKIAGANVYAAKFATSPRTMVAIPAHQIGFLKYARSSDALLPPPGALVDVEAEVYAPRSGVAASLRPFLVMMNDVPMAREDEMARPRPMYLSSTMVSRCGAVHSSARNARWTHKNGGRLEDSSRTPEVVGYATSSGRDVRGGCRGSLNSR